MSLSPPSSVQWDGTVVPVAAMLRRYVAQVGEGFRRFQAGLYPSPVPFHNDIIVPGQAVD
jgi:hypothetical protein